MFVSFAQRAAQGTAVASGSFDTVPLGAGFEATLGARMAVGNKDAGNIFLITECQDSGSSIPACAIKTMEAWGIVTVSADILKSPALTDVGPPQKKKKIYTSGLWGMKRRPQPLRGAKALLSASTFHFEGSKDSLFVKLKEQLLLREHLEAGERPLVVWEPGCMSLTDMREALALVDVVCLSSYVLMRVFGEEAASDKDVVEGHAKELLALGVGSSGNGIITVRRDEEHLVATRDGGMIWTPAFYTKDGHREIYRTGTSSVFVGGFAARFAQTGVVAEAALSGAVAESFAQEQPGLPRRDPSPYSSAAEDYAYAQYGLPRGRAAESEVWNMEGFEARVQQLRGRMEAERRHVQVLLRRRLSGETIVEG
ncbi:hypothetical protein ACHAQA_002206 [Verticillium albo-atrum]